jgi:hypothetical protein
MPPPSDLTGNLQKKPAPAAIDNSRLVRYKSRIARDNVQFCDKYFPPGYPGKGLPNLTR